MAIPPRSNFRADMELKAIKDWLGRFPGGSSIPQCPELYEFLRKAQVFLAQDAINIANPAGGVADWYRNGVFVASRAGGDFNEDGGITIAALDDLANDRVRYFFKAHLPLGKPINADIAAWMGGVINGGASAEHAPYMDNAAGTPLSVKTRYALPIGGYIGDPIVYTDAAMLNGQHDCFAIAPNMAHELTANAATNEGFLQAMFTTPAQAAGILGSEELGWFRIDPGSCAHLAGKQLALTTANGASGWRSWSCLFAPDGNYQTVGGSGPSGGVNFGTPVFTPLFGNSIQTDETFVEMVVPFACTVDKMWVWLSTTQTTNTLDIFCRKNEADTALTINIPNGASAGPYRDNVNSVSYAQGDRLNFRSVQNVGGTSAAVRAIWVKVTPSSGSPRWIGGIVDFFNPNFGNTSWGMLFTRWTGSALTDANTRNPVPRSGTIKNAYGWVSAVGSGNATLTAELAINGTGGNPTLSVGSGVSGVITGTGTKAVVRGDSANFKLVTGGSSGASSVLRTISYAIE